MNVIIDARMVDEHLHGIARYAYEIIKGVSKEDNINIKLLVNNLKISNKIFAKFQNIEFIVMKSKFLSIGEQFELPSIINKYKDDTIFHSPSFVSSPFIKIPMVMTIHDLNHLRFPEYYSWFHKYYYKYIVKNSALRCKRIITVSNFSENEIIDWIKFDKNKVVVTYNGVDKNFRVIEDKIELNRVKKKYDLPDKFVLYIGNLKPHKNVETLIDSMRFIDNIKLIINGKKNESLGKHIAEYKLNDKIQFIGYVDEKDLPIIYNLATVFVFPSLYEGFGLPPLEAMACGCPTIVANTSSLPEVVGKSAILINPHNENDISEKIKNITESVFNESSLINLGFLNVQKFKWTETVKKTIMIYKESLLYT